MPRRPASANQSDVTRLIRGAVKAGVPMEKIAGVKMTKDGVMKLQQCSAHGLRKAAARRLAEAGCGNQQIKAITGHKTDKEVARYTAAADQARLAAMAMTAAYGPDEDEKVSTPIGELDNSADNVLTDKDN